MVDHLELRHGDTVLDLGAATGETGFLAIPHVGEEGKLISSDFAPEMVAAAKRTADSLGIENAEFRVLDAENMELPDGSVDGVLCRWGYMLMGDPGQALRETKRVLRPGRRVAFSVWAGPERNPWMTVPGGLLSERGLLPPRRPDGPGMFSMSDPGKIRELLQGAGFRDAIALEEMEVRYSFSDSDRWWAFISELQGPIAVAIAEMDEAERDEVRAAIEERGAPFRANGGYALPGATVNVVAEA
jgi:SAM-dependent methyltransferase